MDINTVQQYFIKRLQADSRFSDIDLSPDSGIYQTLVLPFSLMAKQIFDINDSATNLQLSNYQNLTEAQMDLLASNFFVVRQQASKTTLEIKIYLTITSDPVPDIVINTTDQFRTTNNQSFTPITNYIFVYATLASEVYNGTTYKVINIICSSDSDFGILIPGSITSSTLTNPIIALVTNIKPSSQPKAKQTNAELYDDITKAITLRNNINNASIVLNYKTKFPTISNIFAIGYGDPEMQRDIAVGSRCWSGHFGGMVDIFTRGLLTSSTFTVTGTRVTAQNKYYFYVKRYKGYDWEGIDTSVPSPNTLLPWTKISLSDSQLAGATELPVTPIILFDWINTKIGNLGYSDFAKKANGEVDFTVEVLNGKNYRYSIYEQLKITVSTTSLASNPTNPTVVLSYQTDSSMEDYQLDINDPANRVICANNLFKSFIPIYVRKLYIVYDKSYTVDEALWRSKISTIINNWQLNESIRFNTLLKDFPAPIRLDEVWYDSNSNLPFDTDSSGQITGINVIIPGTEQYPCCAELVMNNIDGSQNVFGSTRQLYPITKLGLSASSRTSKYFIDPNNIIFVKETW